MSIILEIKRNSETVATGPEAEMGPRFVSLGGAAAGYTIAPAPGQSVPEPVPAAETIAEATRGAPAPSLAERRLAAMRATLGVGASAPAPLPAPAPASLPAPAPPAPPGISRSFTDLVHDPDKAAKIAARMAEIEKLGFAPPPTLFAAGTRMIQMGVDKYAREYREWAACPPAEDVLRETAAQIRAEDRRGLIVSLGDLHMADDGTLGKRGGHSRRIEPEAWSQLFASARAEAVFPDGERLLAVLEAPLRARIWNDRIRAIAPEKDVKVGIRRHPQSGEWSIFRVVGARFPEDGTGADACDTAATAVAGMDYRGSVIYSPGSTDVTFDIAHMASPTTLDPAVGDVFRAGLKGRTNDAGGGAFSVSPFIGRIVCINSTMLDAYAAGVRKAHRGKMDAAIDGIRAAADLSAKVIPLFSQDWATLRSTRINEIDWVGNLGKLSLDTRAILSSDPSAPNVIRALIESGKLDAKLGANALSAAVLAGFAAEPGETLADLINAVTRAAQKVPILVGGQMEAAAGRMVPWMAGLAEA